METLDRPPAPCLPTRSRGCTCQGARGEGSRVSFPVEL